MKQETSRLHRLLTASLLGLILPGESSGQASNDRLAPQVSALLKLRAKDDIPFRGKHESEFFKTLITMAKQQGLDPAKYLEYHGRRPSVTGGAPTVLTDGEAVLLERDDKLYVIVVLSVPTMSLPGVTVQQCVLVDASGRFRDILACEINTRYGDLKTEINKEPEEDRTSLIVRLIPRSQNQWHNWHTITHDGRPFTIYVPRREFPPNEWTTKGLCRVAIRDGKFVVVWPKLGKSDAEVLKEKAGK